MKKNKSKILFLYTDWTKSEDRKKTNGYGAIGYYRILKIAEQLKDIYDITVWGNEWVKKHEEFGKNDEIFYKYIFETYDVVWLSYIDNPKMFAWLHVASNEYGKRVVMDIDDNFLDVDKDNPAYKQYKKNKILKANLGAILSFVDAITVSTLPLKERLQKHFKEIHNIKKDIFVIPNFNDIKDWGYKKEENKKDGVTIGYMGSISHIGDLKMILPAIKTILMKYPNVVFQLMGQLTVKDASKIFKKWLPEIRKRLFLINPTSEFKDFPLWFAEQPWDIGIAPLMDTSFNRCKSSIKWMEYSMYKIPTIASRVYPYYMDVLGKDTIKDGETGLLAITQQDWIDKLSLLIENKELRNNIGKNAFNYIKDNWQYNQNKETIKKIANLIIEDML